MSPNNKNDVILSILLNFIIYKKEATYIDNKE